MVTATETAPRWYGSREVAAAISPARARALIEAALLDDFDPANDPARVNTPAGGGHLLLMPSVIGAWAGIKVASVGPNNPEHGRPRIQATYVLMDSLTLSPQALMEGSLLTALRTPAVSAVAANKLAAPDAGTLLVFGTGLQAWGHIEAMAEIRTLSEVWISGRSARKVEEMVAKARGLGLAARAAVAGDVANADIIVCATSAGEPLFDGSLVKDGAAVVAMGSHETDRRELDANLMGRARVVVEDVQTALREAGDVVMAIEEGRLDAGALLTLSAPGARERCPGNRPPERLQGHRHVLAGPCRCRGRARGSSARTSDLIPASPLQFTVEADLVGRRTLDPRLSKIRLSCSRADPVLTRARGMLTAGFVLSRRGPRPPARPAGTPLPNGRWPGGSRRRRAPLPGPAGARRSSSASASALARVETSGTCTSFIAGKSMAAAGSRA